jgi:hypothetical protein
MLLPEERPTALVTRQQFFTASGRISRMLGSTGVRSVDKSSDNSLPTQVEDRYRSYYPYRPTVVWTRDNANLAARLVEEAASSLVASRQPRSWVAAGLGELVLTSNRAALQRCVDSWRGGLGQNTMSQYVAEQLDTLLHTANSGGRLASLLLKSLQAEVWYRAVEYLSELENGRGGSNGAAGRVQMRPAIRRAYGIRPFWVDVPTPGTEEFYVWLQDDMPGLENTDGQPSQQLAASLELARADLDPSCLLRERRTDWMLPPQIVANKLFDRLAILLERDDSILRVLTTSAVGGRLIRVAKPVLLGEPIARRAQKPVLDDMSSQLEDLRGVTESELRRRRRLWLLDPQATYRVMTFLRATPLADRPQLTYKLAVGITELIKSPPATGVDNVWIQDQMRVLNSATWDLASSNVPKLEEVLQDLLFAINPIVSPFAATLNRCFATVATKRNDHADALVYMQRALEQINNSKEVKPSNDVYTLNLVESEQQVQLQLGGALVRALEGFLRSPRHLYSVNQGKAGRFAGALADRTVEHLWIAYSRLMILEQELPDFPQPFRVSTVAWRFNTRYQLIRAMLLRYLVHSAWDRMGNTHARKDESRLALDTVHVIYREATEAATGQQQYALLTQLSLLYAFLTGGRFLAPSADAKEKLPDHLTHPQCVHAGEDWCDRDGASHYLDTNQIDAGVLANLRWRPAQDLLIHASSDPCEYIEWRLQWDPNAHIELKARFKRSVHANGRNIGDLRQIRSGRQMK